MKSNNQINWWMIIAVIAVLLLVLGGFGTGGFGCGSGYGMMSGFYGSGTGWGFMGGFMIIFWILIILLIVWIVKQNQNNSYVNSRMRR